ncbi:tripartite transporter, partial [Enterococcus hirae]
RSIAHPASSPAMPPDESLDRAALYKQTLPALVPPVILIVAVLGSILGGIATPTEAAGVGAVGALLLAGYRQAGAKLPVVTAAASLIAI